MQELAALVLVDRQHDEPADRHAAAVEVVEAERIRGGLELPDLPGDSAVIGIVHHLDTGDEATVERSLKSILAERSLHEIEPTAAGEVLVAVRVLLIADPHRAQDRQFPHLQPEVGDAGEWARVFFRGVYLVVDVDLVGEVIFGDPIVNLVHPALDAEAGSPNVHRVVQRRIEAALERRLSGARACGERRRIDLCPATNFDAKILVGRLSL